MLPTDALNAITLAYAFQKGLIAIL